MLHLIYFFKFTYIALFTSFSDILWQVALQKWVLLRFHFKSHKKNATIRNDYVGYVE